MYHFLRVFIILVVSHLLKSVEAKKFLLLSQQNYTINLEHALTRSLHVTVKATDNVQLYISFCSPNNKKLISSGKTIKANLTSTDFYNLREQTKCILSASTFYEPLVQK